MKRETWRKRIKEACVEAGTYRPYFDSVIFSLAEILETRDEVKKYYRESGAKPIVEHTNKGGNTNIVKNPILIMYDEMNATALTYWRELGLTPKGLKAINDKAMKEKSGKKSLEDIFSGLGM